MKAILLSTLLFFSVNVFGNDQDIEKVAQYSVGDRGTKQFELFAFYQKMADQPVKIEYSYGENEELVSLTYLGETRVDGTPAFDVKFPNGYRLSVIPKKDLSLEIKDKNGKYDKHFTWMYEGPVDGIGTFCSSCAEDEKDAMQVLINDYIGVKTRMSHGSLEWL